MASQHHLSPEDSAAVDNSTTTPLSDNTTSTTNPFDDPSGYEAPMDPTAVLTVDRNATLSLGTDALIVLDEGLRHRRRTVAQTFCNLLPAALVSPPKTTRAIPYHHILWADLSPPPSTTDDHPGTTVPLTLTIHHATSANRSASACRVSTIAYPLASAATDKSLHAHATQWLERLLARSYPHHIARRKRIKVLINPFGGQGNAQHIWETAVAPVLAAAGCRVDVERTRYRGHAEEIARELDLDAYDVVACASGDGLPHEVFNGLARHVRAPRRALRRIAVCQIPCGSGNAMCLNLCGTTSPSWAAVEIVKAVRTPLDLIAITQPSREEPLYSFLSQAVGIIAESDLGTDSLRWMGAFRFTWGVLVRLLGKTIYPAEISMLVDVEDKAQVRDTYCAISAAHDPSLPGHVEHGLEEEDDEEEDPTLSSLPPSAEQQPLQQNPQQRQQQQQQHHLLPPLQHGRITDPIPATFHTTDMPTLGNFYVGNMCYMSADAPFFAASLPADGQMDLITIAGDIPRTTALSMVTSIDAGTLINFPEVAYRKVRAYRIVPRPAASALGGGKKGKGKGGDGEQPRRRRQWQERLLRWLGGAGAQTEGLIAIDGESVPFEAFQAEVVPGVATVLSKHGAFYGFDGRKLLV